MSPLTPDQREEIARSVAANRATQEAISKAERKERGEVELLLERASDDLQENEPPFQEELTRFARALKSTGVEHSQYAIAFDAVDGGGYPVAQFLIVLGPPAVAAAAAACGAWVQAKYGRKVRLKIGDVEAEGRTVEEIERLLKQAADFQESHAKDRDA